MTKRAGNPSPSSRRSAARVRDGGWLPAIGLAMAAMTMVWLLRSRTNTPAPAAVTVRAAPSAPAAHPSARAAGVVNVAPPAPDRPRSSGREAEETAPRPLTSRALTIPAGDSSSCGSGTLAVPVAAVPPEADWQLDADQLAAYERVGRDFLTATASPVGTTDELDRQWTQARRASDAQFEQLFGTERFASQQLKAATAPVDAAH